MLAKKFDRLVPPIWTRSLTLVAVRLLSKRRMREPNFEAYTPPLSVNLKQESRKFGNRRIFFFDAFQIGEGDVKPLPVCWFDPLPCLCCGGAAPQ
jgi:hypothetical protein